MNGLELDDAALERAAVVTVPALLTLSTVAQLLDCHPRTVRRRIDAGLLPAVREDSRLMVRGDALRSYVDELEHERVDTARPRRSPRRRSSSGTFDFLREP